VFDYRRCLLEFADLALAGCARFEIAGAHSQNETCVEQSGPNWAWSRPVARRAGQQRVGSGWWRRDGQLDESIETDLLGALYTTRWTIEAMKRGVVERL